MRRSSRLHSCHQCQDNHFQQDQEPLQSGHPSYSLLPSHLIYIDQIHLARRYPQRALEGLAHVRLLDPHHAADVVPAVRDRVLPAGQLNQASVPPGPVDDPSGVNATEAAAGVGLVDGGFHRLDAICNDGSRFSTFNLDEAGG